MKSTARPKLLIIGSGFHRHILGNPDSPLSCWITLLNRIARQCNINICNINFSNPTLAWESMVTEFVKKDESRANAAFKMEDKMRETAIRILKDESDRHQNAYLNHPLAIQISKFSGHIVNLNFDHLFDKLLGIQDWDKAFPPFLHSPKTKDKQQNYAGLYRRHVAKRDDTNHAIIWHPHGTTQLPHSLQLGLRDYGLRPSISARAFKYFKRWERNALEQYGAKLPLTEQDYFKLLEQAELMDNEGAIFEESDIKLHDNWVTRFMLFDLVIIGAGLSLAEVDLHWLLVQRQRNFARISDATKRPSAVYYDFKHSDPINLMRIDFGSWEAAWENALY
jgi:hypothetical protein